MTDVQKDPDREFAALVGRGTPSTRRGLLAGAGALGTSALLAACGTGKTGTTSGAGTGPEPPAGSAKPGTGDTGGGSNGGGAALAATADVPVGGGVIKDALVITQPKEGEFKAFSNVCTHQQCKVTKIANGTINCPCHGSKFSIEDGSPKSGPAQKPLAETKVKVDGDNIVEA
jgi:Rieske Fe-S protein